MLGKLLSGYDDKTIRLRRYKNLQRQPRQQTRRLHPDAVSSRPASTWAIMEKFWVLDLSELGSLMQDRYSVFGSAPRLPSDMLHSLLLSFEFKVFSYTTWAADLKENHLHAILSGVFIGDTPGTGTFYDFLGRLWLSDKDNLSDPAHPSKENSKKPDKKDGKAPSVEKVTVKDLFQQFEAAPPTDMEPCRLLYEIFKVLFLEHSVQDGLIDLFSLSLAGDGTPVYTVAQERKKRTCDCLEKGIRDCKCNRIYSQPDCDIGRDSHRDRYYFGYDLYMLIASDSENDLPVFPFLGPAFRHDSIGFLYNWFSMKQFLPEALVS